MIFITGTGCSWLTEFVPTNEQLTYHASNYANQKLLRVNNIIRYIYCVLSLYFDLWSSFCSVGPPRLCAGHLWCWCELLRLTSQPCLNPPKSKWHVGQSRLLFQTFISAECVRSLRLLTDKCLGNRCWLCSLVHLSTCRVADWLHANWPEYGCAYAAYVSC